MFMQIFAANFHVEKDTLDESNDNRFAFSERERQRGGGGEAYFDVYTAKGTTSRTPRREHKARIMILRLKETA